MRICGTFKCICVSSDRTELLSVGSTRQRHPKVNGVNYTDWPVNRNVTPDLLVNPSLSKCLNNKHESHIYRNLSQQTGQVEAPELL